MTDERHRDESPRRELRCAIVGTGGVAVLHARAVAAHPRARLVAVTDLDPARADAFAHEFGDPAVFDTLPALLTATEIDVVLICTPPSAHADQTLEAFAAGAHVIVEKPPASSLAELERMTAAARAADRTLAVVFQQRTGTAAAHVRGLLRSGALGQPLVAVCQTLWYRDPAYYAVDWRGKWETEGGGTTLGHGIHQIDLLAHLLGDWASVRGELWRAARDIETEDVSTATVTFANGVVAAVVTSAVSPRQLSSVRIDTERATVSVEHVYGHGHENWSITPAPGIGEAEAATWALPEVEERSDHGPLLRDVFDALLDGTPLPDTATVPERSFEIVAALYASAAAGGAVITPEGLADHPTHRRSFAAPVIDQRSLGVSDR
jgi:predicted dehydrogenase